MFEWRALWAAFLSLNGDVHPSSKKPFSASQVSGSGEKRVHGADGAGTKEAEGKGNPMKKEMMSPPTQLFAKVPPVKLYSCVIADFRAASYSMVLVRL